MLAAALLAWLPADPARADTLPEKAFTCNFGHYYNNETNRAAVLTVQVFNGCSSLEETIEINLILPDGPGETVKEVRQRETRAVSIEVPQGGAVQVRGPGGSGEFKSSFSVVPRSVR
jgi:hypothetical protein